MIAQQLQHLANYPSEAVPAQPRDACRPLARQWQDSKPDEDRAAPAAMSPLLH